MTAFNLPKPSLIRDFIPSAIRCRSIMFFLTFVSGGSLFHVSEIRQLRDDVTTIFLIDLKTILRTVLLK